MNWWISHKTLEQAILLLKSDKQDFASWLFFKLLHSSIFLGKFEKSESITSSWSLRSLHPDHLGVFKNTHATEPMSIQMAPILTSHMSSRTQGGRIVDSNAQPDWLRKDPNRGKTPVAPGSLFWKIEAETSGQKTWENTVRPCIYPSIQSPHSKFSGIIKGCTRRTTPQAQPQCVRMPVESCSKRWSSGGREPVVLASKLVKGIEIHG